MDSLEKPQSSEKGKEEKKRKEKKGMLGGLFKRKDKKTKGHEDDAEDSKRSLEETSRESPQPKESLESLSQESQKSIPQSPQRQTSKLQKTPPAKLSTSMNTPAYHVEPVSPISTRLGQQKHTIPPPSRAPPSIEVDDAGFVPESRLDPGQAKSNARPVQPKGSSVDVPSEGAVDIEPPHGPRRGMFSRVKDDIQSSSSLDRKPEPVKPVQHRMALDDFDSSSEPEERPDPLHRSSPHHPPRVTTTGTQERLSESPVDVAQVDQLRKQHPPGLVVDTSSQEDPTISPSPASSAELIETPRNQKEREATPASTAHSSNSVATWSDANLRAYLEDDSDIRDLLTLVKDKSDMKPPSRDHPIVKDLFKEENKKLADMSKELDGLLEGFLERRAKARREKSLEGISQAHF